MRNFLTSVLFMFTLLQFILSPAFSAEYTSSLKDQKKISVTIYNRNLALIKDSRSITLPKGQNILAFTEVSGQIKPETALLSSDNLQVLEQNFEFDLLTPASLLEKYVGREVTVIKVHPTTGEESSVKAKVLSANNGTVLQIGNQIETGVPGRLVFDNVPRNLRDRPTLTMLIESRTDELEDVELSYLTTGLGWKADYVAELNEGDTALNMSSWVTLTNTSGASYRNASLQLVAGDVNQVQPERVGRPEYRAALMQKEAVADGMAEEQMFEYHLYTLDRPTTIGDNQKKQVSLLQAQNVLCRKEFLLQGNSHYYQKQYGEIGQKMKVAVYVEIENRVSNNLGVPLPKGVVRVYKKDSQERLQFIGEDRIDHTPENEIIRLKLGDAFDITANMKQVDFKKLSGFSSYNYVYESAFRIELKNGKKEAVTVKVVEPVPGDWQMIAESLPHEKLTSNMAGWQVPVPALGSTVLTYRVRVRY
ncbi:MAG: DUF4139 domain-containing protein [Desulfurivibrionaceae bacterium]|nr:DUF4139 domain-containing protein [Desulfurivibrionaceae bacterium]